MNDPENNGKGRMLEKVFTFSAMCQLVREDIRKKRKRSHHRQNKELDAYQTLEECYIQKCERTLDMIYKNLVEIDITCSKLSLPHGSLKISLAS